MPRIPRNARFGRRGLRLPATALGLCLAVSVGVAAQEPAARSPRNASYRIDVTLDDEAKTLDGRQVLTWRNIQTAVFLRPSPGIR
jgi:hypothetical protein